MKPIELWHGDCLELMEDISDGSVDLVLADPPYGTTACKWDSIIPFEPMWEQLKRIVKRGGAIVLFGSEPFSSLLRISNIDWYKYDWVWEKEQSSSGLQSKIAPMKKHENISVFFQAPTDDTTNAYQPLKEYFQSEKEKSGLNSKQIKELQGLHPTQKPVALLEYLIRTYTNSCETVLDFTMGCGSTGVACVNTNRRFIGIELDDDYFNIAKQRINACVKTLILDFAGY